MVIECFWFVFIGLFIVNFYIINIIFDSISFIIENISIKKIMYYVYEILLL